MTSSERRRDAVNQALAEADDILKTQDDLKFRLKVGDSLNKEIVVVGDHGHALTESELQNGPSALTKAWCSMKGSRLLRIAIYYRLFFLDETLDSDDALRSRASATASENSLVMDVYTITEAEQVGSQQTPEDAFADALQVYTCRLDEVNPKRTAHLRRAIKAGCLEADPDDLFVEGEENWLPWILAAEMPQRENFQASIVIGEARTDNEDHKLRRSRAIGEGIGRGITDAMKEFVDDLALHDSESEDSTNETSGGRAQAVKRMLESARPLVNVYALPSLAEFVVMCAAGTMIVCMVLIGFRFLRLL